ncbi:ISL3 family transposase, partial [Kurthia zopfii]
MKNGKKKHSFTNSFILKMLNNKRKKGELCYMKSIMNMPGLKDVLITKIEEIEGKYALYIELPKVPHTCPS